MCQSQDLDSFLASVSAFPQRDQKVLFQEKIIELSQATESL